MGINSAGTLIRNAVFTWMDPHYVFPQYSSAGFQRLFPLAVRLISTQTKVGYITHRAINPADEHTVHLMTVYFE
jgi:hypothetical protein